MHVNNTMFAYYDQTFYLILPMTDRHVSTAAMVLKYDRYRYHTIKSP